MADVKLALTIAGSETSGACGMQADLKTFEEYGVYGLVALTSIVTMDPENGWAHDVYPIDLHLLKKQLKTALSGRKINAMKTGMLASLEVIELVRSTIDQHHLQNVVIDPVMVCKGENTPLNVDAANALRDILLPVADITTPNLFEAGILSGLGTLKSVDDMKAAAQKINALGAKCVVVKGGRALPGDVATDVFFDGKEYLLLEKPKIQDASNNGAGCTFAAAVTAGLATGLSIPAAVVKAKAFVYAAIKHGFRFNQYIGQVYHGGCRVEAELPNS